MQFSELAKYLDKLERTSSRNDITEILADLFKNSDAKEIDKTTYLLLGILAPNYRGIVFNVAEKMMVEVLASVFGLESNIVKKTYKKVGDLGDSIGELAQISNFQFPVPKRSVNDVYEDLVSVANLEGEGSQEAKVNGLADIIKDLDPLSAKYVTRIPVGKLRLGFSDKTIIDGLSWMVAGDKSETKRIKRAYEVLPDVGLIAKQIKTRGIDKATEDVTPEIGVPIMPVLAQRIKTTQEMVDKMGEVAVEPKFDGVRVLIHYAKEKDGEKPFVRAFTRNLNDVTEMFPELQEMGKYLDAKEVILDSEGVGIDPKTERIVDFQKTMTRRRKHGIGQSVQDVPLRFQLFDVIYLNGKGLMGETYEKRREVLSKIIKKNKLLVIDDYVVTDDADFIRNEHQRLIDEGLEGIIVKRLDSKYVPGRTGWRWVKMKEAEDSVAKLADTLDCVVMGYTRGKGKRASFGVGQFLAGVRDGDKFKTVTKVGTGLTDDQFKELAKRLKELEVKEKPEEYEFPKELEPDFWVKPSLVVELAADEITKSPKHTSGYALRFPRLVKFRDDKGATEATTTKEIKQLSKLQKG